MSSVSKNANGNSNYYSDMIGVSPSVQCLLEQINMVAPTNANVMICGESGTGKELVAHEIHKRSLRRKKPMVKVNCASIPRELFESEFFGHIKGSFSGAVRDRRGRFQVADGGTLFLDEIGELPIDLQSKLLRVLQEGIYERIGEDFSRRVDTRIITATNRDLSQEVEDGNFRQDLYFRLSVFPIVVDPLCKRLEDISVLSTFFIKKSCERIGIPLVDIKKDDILKLQSYHWPGNIRELQNVLERAVILSQGGRLSINLPDNSEQKPIIKSNALNTKTTTEIVTEPERIERDKENILNALKITNGKIYGSNGTANLLGIKPTTLASRMKKLGIEKSMYIGGMKI